MRKLSIVWFVHFVSTVAGWYLLGALAQGALDSAGDPPFLLTVFNAIITLLCFPIVFVMLATGPVPVGGFSLGSFFAFALLAAINSAVVVAIIAAVIRAVRNRNAESA